MGNEILSLNWVGRRTQAGGHRFDDVSILLGHTTKEKRCMCFTFRNGVSNLFSDTDYAVIAIFKNRVYFKGANQRDGLKLCTNKETKQDTRYFRIGSERDVEHLIPFIGDYELKHDSFYDLYYIENSEMNKEE